ncbi:MAG: hydrogen peroxide-inducible genes activator [Bdellovibrionales bacterium]
MPTITQLQYIVAVYKHRHFGKAADFCHVSQPSLSTQILKVEEDLGFHIFDRGNKPIGITEKGELFIKQAQQVLLEHDRLIHVGQEVGGEVRGTFTLGIIPTIAPYVIHLFIESFAKKYPLVQLIIREMETHEIVESIRDHAVDAGLLATPLTFEGIIERPLYYEPFYLYVGSKDPLVQKKRVTVKDIDPERLWLLRDGHCLRSQILHFCKTREGQTIFSNIQFEGGNLETLRYLVRRGQGVTFLPYLFVSLLSKSERNANVKPFTRPMPSREVGLVFSDKLWKMQILDALEEVIYDSVPEELRQFKPNEMEILPIE